MAPAVELDGVTKRYGDTAAVDDVSLSVREGEFFTLVGPSGCGKTTTLRLIAGFEEPTAGTIRFSGESVAGASGGPGRGRRLPELRAVPAHDRRRERRLRAQLRRPARGNESLGRVAELLELVDLPDAADRDPESLSGGQQQRVAMAARSRRVPISSSSTSR